jgi:hypothetical protein
MDNSENDKATVPLKQVRDVINTVLLPIPWPWLIAMALAILVSLFTFTQNSKDGVTVSFQLTAITAGLFALIWLPFLLKVIALTGGGIKGLGGEATVAGILEIVDRLEPSDRREALPALIATVETIEPKSPPNERLRLRQVREALESELLTLAPEAQQAREELQEYAKEYEAVRQKSDPGARRTLSMTKIIAQSMGIAKRAGYGSIEVSDIFASDSEGDRIIALAIIQALPNADFFNLVLESIYKSRSAFEQYQALCAAEKILPLLDDEQKSKLAEVLEDQRSGAKGKYITQGSDRWALSERLLDTIS